MEQCNCSIGSRNSIIETYSNNMLSLIDKKNTNKNNFTTYVLIFLGIIFLFLIYLYYTKKK